MNIQKAGKEILDKLKSVWSDVYDQITDINWSFRRLLSPEQNILYGFFLYTFVGWVLLSLPVFHKEKVDIIDNVFIATSAVSTTGLTTVSVSDSYNTLGQIVIMCLFQLGGIGYMTFTTFFLLSTTRNVTHWHKKLLEKEFDMPANFDIKDFLKAVVAFTLIIEAIGAVLFFIAFKMEDVETGFAIWSSIFHSVSAFCTAGFGLYNDSFVGFSENIFINLIICALSICGGLGFIVLTDVWYRVSGENKKITFTSRLIVIAVFALILTGAVLIYFFESSLQDLSYKEKILPSFFQSMTAVTTVGFNTIEIGSFSLPILLVITFLMYIGASPSGTAGGMKVTTLTSVSAIIFSRLRGKKRVVFIGKQVPYQRVYLATSIFIFYTGWVFLGTFLLSITEDFSLKSVLFEVASALGTVGLSTGITDSLSMFGKILIIIFMFIGRIGVLTFGYALLKRRRRLEDDESKEDPVV